MARHVHIWVHDAQGHKPAGSPQGGQFTSGSGGGESGGSKGKSWGRQFAKSGKIERIFINIMEMEPRPQDIDYIVHRANSIDDVADYMWDRWFSEWKKEDPSVPSKSELRSLVKRTAGV